jgi:hypothetical protein
MKNSKKRMRNALYILLPLCFFAVIHLLFSYGNWELNPKYWSETARVMSAFVGLIVAALGIFTAYSINED